MDEDIVIESKGLTPGEAILTVLLFLMVFGAGSCLGAEVIHRKYRTCVGTIAIVQDTTEFFNVNPQCKYIITGEY